MIISETSSRTDLELAALELGMADTGAGCDAILKMTDLELFEAIAAFIEANNEAAPF